MRVPVSQCHVLTDPVCRDLSGRIGDRLSAPRVWTALEGQSSPQPVWCCVQAPHPQGRTGLLHGSPQPSQSTAAAVPGEPGTRMASS